MPWARYTFAIGLVNGKFYLVGGWGDNTVQEYDLATRTWSIKASMPTSRGGSGYDVINGLIYVVGGRGGVSNEFECYDALVDSWSTLTPMPTPREGLVACGVGNDLYAITGSVPISQGGLPYYGENEKASDLTAVGELLEDYPHFQNLSVTPNPGREQIVVNCTLPLSLDASMTIYDSSGRTVTHLSAKYNNSEQRVFEWNCQNEQREAVPAGVYFIQLRSDKHFETTKVLIVR
jgi:hypothetical protein